jgi:hypothetical protein
MAVWLLEVGYVRAGPGVLDQVSAEIEALRAREQYEGRQLLGSDVRSVDRQSSDRAVVTVRETWQDRLYEFSDYPGEGGEPLAQRGPYALDVTYTLERGPSGWLVTRAVFAGERPNWQGED